MPKWCSITLGEASARLRIPAKSDKETADASVDFIYGMRDALVRYAEKYLELTDGIYKVLDGQVDSY